MGLTAHTCLPMAPVDCFASPHASAKRLAAGCWLHSSQTANMMLGDLSGKSDLIKPSYPGFTAAVLCKRMGEPGGFAPAKRQFNPSHGLEAVAHIVLQGASHANPHPQAQPSSCLAVSTLFHSGKRQNSMPNLFWALICVESRRIDTSRPMLSLLPCQTKKIHT